MTELTDAQWSLLNTRGSEGLREARASGELPDCVEVNSRIATRCLWENPNMWTWGRWFHADYVNAKYRSGRVAVRKVTYPDESVGYTVVAPNGRWSDTLKETEAKTHLKACRIHGALTYLTEAEVNQAENDHNWALSR